ncbi:MAG: hypothetical protein WAP55_00060 [Minisyncoccia bacterium]
MHIVIILSVDSMTLHVHVVVVVVAQTILSEVHIASRAIEEQIREVLLKQNQRAKTLAGFSLVERVRGIGHNSRLAAARLGCGPASRFLDSSRDIAPAFDSPASK